MGHRPEAGNHFITTRFFTFCFLWKIYPYSKPDGDTQSKISTSNQTTTVAAETTREARHSCPNAAFSLFAKRWQGHAMEHVLAFVWLGREARIFKNLYQLVGFFASPAPPHHLDTNASISFSYFTLVTNFLQTKNINSRHVFSLTKSYHNKIV